MGELLEMVDRQDLTCGEVHRIDDWALGDCARKDQWAAEVGKSPCRHGGRVQSGRCAKTVRFWRHCSRRAEFRCKHR
ncbi:hypothetical protein [Lentibacter algarum]|uniref:hypothetical protein n=1 Tax=Lentibacter algarum TaxID=576131 RepID=UPI003AF41949